MSSASHWIFQLATQLERRNAPHVVELLNPKVQIKGKDKIDQEQNPQEFMQAKRVLNENGIALEQAEWEAFLHWGINFLKHSRFLDQQGSWESTCNANEVFQAFQESYRGFEKVCGFEVMDGKWISMIVDHMTEMLVGYAEEADYET